MINVRWTGEGSAVRADTLAFLRDASTVLFADAQATHDGTAVAAAQTVYDGIATLSESSNASDVTALANQYEAARQKIAQATGHPPYSAPPVWIAVPAAVNDAHPQVDELPASGWGQTVAHAAQVLANGDTLRGAINRWADWWESSVVPTSDRSARAAGLRAWAEARLSAIAADVAAATPLPTPTPDAIAPAAVPAHSGWLVGGIGAAIGIGLGAAYFLTRRRR